MAELLTRAELEAEIADVDADLERSRGVEPVSEAAAGRKRERIEILERQRARFLDRLEAAQERGDG